MKHDLFSIFCVVILTAARAGASTPTSAPATAPATAPTTAPATASAAARKVTIPPGFKLVEVDQRRALCEPVDEKWVRAALQHMGPTTMPSTMPADLVHRLSDRRDLLKVRISSDLALPDNAPIDELLSKTLVTQVSRLSTVRPPVFMLVCSDVKLKSIVKNGWAEPRFHYNRVADEIAYDPDLRLSEEGPVDDVVLPAIYRENLTDESILSARLIEEIRRHEAGVGDALARRAMVVTQMTFIEFIHKNAIEPLGLKEDQLWFAVGVEAVLSAKYMADLASLNRNDLLERITRDNPRNPIRSATIDLLHPADRSTMRPEWVPAYDDAYRAKSTRVVNEWSKNSGESAVALVLSALRRKPPADGAGLIKLIQVTTSADLTEATRAK